jgi:hypothetical protein
MKEVSCYEIELYVLLDSMRSLMALQLCSHHYTNTTLHVVHLVMAEAVFGSREKKPFDYRFNAIRVRHQT